MSETKAKCSELDCQRERRGPRSPLCIYHYNRQFKPPIQKACAYCDGPFFVYPCTITRTFCSRKCASLSFKTHGMSRNREGRIASPEYMVWNAMKSRCFVPTHKNYSNYGGRGITVCDRWLTFENFFADMGPRPSPKHSLDRYPDNNGSYEPGNVRWATLKQQHRNKRTARLVSLGPFTLCVSAWSEVSGVGKATITGRLNKGWEPRRAIFQEPLEKVAA